jgi:hypothetical protein
MAVIRQDASKYLGRVDELFDDEPGCHEMHQSQKGLAQFLIARRNMATLFEGIAAPFHLLASRVEGLVSVERGSTSCARMPSRSSPWSLSAWVRASSAGTCVHTVAKTGRS